MAGRVLVVEDAPEIADVVRSVLTAVDLEVRVVQDGVAALEEADRWDPDVVILDLGLPGIDGFEVCRRLRLRSDRYVLMLTARADEVDRVVGLSLGADDYVTKPFSPRELQARVQALLRRPRSGAAGGAEPLSDRRTFGSVVVDVTSRLVLVSGTEVQLTRIEFDILDALSENPRRVLTRPQLRDRVWGGDWLADDHAVDVHVSNLRRKLKQLGATDHISTVRGVGYRMTSERG